MRVLRSASVTCNVFGSIHGHHSVIPCDIDHDLSHQHRFSDEPSRVCPPPYCGHHSFPLQDVDKASLCDLAGRPVCAGRAAKSIPRYQSHSVPPRTHKSTFRRRATRVETTSPPMTPCQMTTRCLQARRPGLVAGRSEGRSAAD